MRQPGLITPSLQIQALIESAERHGSVPTDVMLTQKLTSPKICILTQTASDIRPYYREFFADLDLFFVTFKQKHPDAVDFIPGSTWSDGRNRLWEHVRGRYDYYIFIDDDLEFLCIPTRLPITITRVLQAKVNWQKKLRLRGLVERILCPFQYQKADPVRFRKLLFEKLNRYRPHVASVALTADDTPFLPLDQYTLYWNRRVRPQGWFDAQVTIFSELGASLLLPYDTQISGWWSSQIPIYVLAHLAFKDRAINIVDLASRNANHEIYRPGYDGYKDCLEMSAWLSPGILDPAVDAINLPDNSFITHDFASEFCKTKVKPAKPTSESLETALTDLGKSFDLHHPYIYDRHKEIVDRIESSASTMRQKEAHG